MLAVLKTLVISLLILLLPFQLCFAAEKDSIVWLADGVSIKDTKQVYLYPITDDTDSKRDHDITHSLANTIRDELGREGLNLTEIKNNILPNNFALKINIVLLRTGSVGGRWVGFGGGAAVCILRTYLIDGPSGKIVGDIVVAKQVSTGGLFSAGADKYIPSMAAKQTAKELAELFGVKLKTGEEEVSSEDSFQ
ncbi:MAG: hypothetical protein KAU29_05640 [Gammaproteobacteria bacterium]|nr:hypothetical protein [Gammaproteobacteria bacterium]